MSRKIVFFSFIIVLLSISFAAAQTGEPLRYDAPLVRVKDVARVQGVRENQIFGLGLVIGLQGTGDGSGANTQMMANMLDSFGITISAKDLKSRNIAAVMVTADLPTSIRMGDRLDVTISSIGDARSLQGGFLLQTPLQAANGQIFAVAQGAVSIGGFVVKGGGGGSGIQVNHTTVGIVPSGAIVERELEVYDFAEDGIISMVLHEPDFTTASRLVQIINDVYEENVAWARDQGTVEIQIPQSYLRNVVGFIAALEELPIRPDVNARVVINERTGTVVMGSQVKIATVAVSHGNLKVHIQNETTISHPPSFSGGDTVVSTEMKTSVEEEPSRFAVLGGNANVQDLVDALNAVGVTPRDIIAILQAVKAAGALFGELIII